MNFFDKFLGQWTTKKNISILKYNYKYTYEEKIKITKNEEKSELCLYKLNYINNQLNLKCFNNFFEKEISTNKYNIKKINENLLKINRKLNKEISYTEYIYFVNNNFNTSIGFIKKKYSYLATIFTSYIKI
uniref:Uncharacterized protein n=1 Tax=Caloglossa monosticha TaxID=76906 RepID=A0A1Z1M4T8_9FLOR|nr:hypothetical protein [Caloglossa monosticha]ARW61026.1 hypothetical protein [Caloglossa monosticha]